MAFFPRQWCACLAAIATGVAAGAAPVEIWVAPGGATGGSGTRESPLGDVHLALRQVRELRRTNDPAVADGARIVLRGGNYELEETLFVRAEDSGTAAAPLVVAAAPGERPVLSGGRTITGWRRLEGDLAGVPSTARGEVWAADVPRAGGEALRFRQLWVNGAKAVRARTPNGDGMERITAWDKATGEVGIESRVLAGLSDPAGTELVLLQMWEIAILRIRAVRAADAELRVRFESPESRLQAEHPWPPPVIKPGGNSPYFLTNRIEFLDEPGEWHLDARSGRVYYWPREGEDLASARVVAPALETLVEVAGTLDRPVRHVKFEGIGFAHTTWLRPSTHGHVPLQAGMFMRDAYKLTPKGTPDWRSLDNQAWVGRPPAAVSVAGAEGVAFVGCRFERTAASGLDLVSGVRDASVEGSVFRDIGINGVQLGSFQDGPEETHLPYRPANEREIVTGARIANNLLTDTANEDWGGLAIAAGFVREATIAHNHVADTSYTAISLGWGWTRTPNAMHRNRVEANRIVRFATRMADTGGIYTLSAQPGTVIAGNVIEEPVLSPWVHDSEHWGFVYLDEGSAFITVKDNWCPREKFIRNANGPGNVWETNGPAVSEAIRAAAGLEERYRGLLAELTQAGAR